MMKSLTAAANSLWRDRRSKMLYSSVILFWILL